MPADLEQLGNFDYTEVGSGAITYDGFNLGFLKDVTFISNMELEKLYTGNPLQLRGQKGKQYVCQLQAEMFEVSDLDKTSLLLGGGIVPTAVGGSPETHTDQSKTFAAPIGRSVQEIFFDLPSIDADPSLFSSAYQTATNSPTAGSTKDILIPDTGDFVDGGYAVIKDDDHEERILIDSIVADTKIVATTLAHGYTTPKVYPAYAEGSDYILDRDARPFALAYRLSSGLIPSAATILTTYSGTPPTGRKLKLGSSFQVARKPLVFEHYNNDTGKIWKSTFWISSPDAKANMKWTDSGFVVPQITFDSIPDLVGHPDSPYGEIYQGNPSA